VDCFSDAGTIGPVEDTKEENSLGGITVDLIQISSSAYLILSQCVLRL